MSAAEKDVVLRFAAAVKAELQASGARIALVSRSGLDLSRFGQRYSHAGIALAASPESPWAVRQLYYACEEERPRLFDQGLSAFLLGAADAQLGYVSVVFLPPEAAAPLEQAALDRERALALLAARYSANAYPYSERYQNCNQWVAELMAAAWGGASARAPAQAWLRETGYAPTVFETGNPLMMLAARFLPWLHRDDHPADDLDAWRFRVSMPASLEAFVRERWPGATRVELCHDGRGMVVRRGWGRIAEGCRAGEGDSATALP